jgi:hypothetical protein
MAEPSNLAAARQLLDEAREMINEQRAAVETLRTRALALLSVGSLIATFFGTHLPKHLSRLQHVEVVVALAAFGISAVLAMAIVTPRDMLTGFELTTTLDLMKEGEEVREYDLAVMRAEGLEADAGQNESKVTQLSWFLTAVCGLVALQVVAWALAALL